MADAEIIKYLSSCPTPEAGCFAGDPDAFQVMLDGEDMVVRADLQRSAEAATDAAIDGVPIEEAMYIPAVLEPISAFTPRRLGLDSNEVMEGRVGSAPNARFVIDEQDDDISRLRHRIARCAYVCGTTAVGCPLRMEPEE